MRLSLVACLGVSGLNLAACSSGDSGTRTIEVDYNFDDFAGSFLSYFPRNVTVRPGMTVKFHQTWTGAPHTVTFGRARRKDQADLDSSNTPERRAGAHAAEFDAEFF